MAHVLCTGIDCVLLETRKMLLEQAGHRVTTVTSENELVDACAMQPFNVAVIGQAVSTPQKQRIIVLVRQHCPGARVLELYQANTKPVLKDADAWLETPVAVPRDLPTRVAELAGESEPSQTAEDRTNE